MAPADVLGLLETDRLILRPSVVEDGEVFHRMWTERDPRVPPHRRISSDGRPTVDDVAARIASAESAATGLRLLTVERRAAGDVIGYCGLIPDGSGSPDEAELAYELVRTAHGRGYATEAAAAVVAWASEAGYRRLRAGVWDWNAASRGVLRKLGFREVGYVEPTSEHGRSLLTVREL